MENDLAKNIDDQADMVYVCETCKKVILSPSLRKRCPYCGKESLR